MSEVDVLSVDRGHIVAPAGCGKTQLIVEAINSHKETKPILVLTHTNAGVAALRHRLNLKQSRSQNYRLATIDGWALRLVSTFPLRSGYSDGPNPKKPNYVKIRKAARTLLQGAHIDDVLLANYSRILVDEYQDCSINQHAVIYYAGKKLPVCVLGDPMQAIFGFGDDRLAKWDEEVCKHFPKAGELSKPWRWVNAKNEELGDWLLAVRKTLLAGQAVDLKKAPGSVRWVQLSDDGEDHMKLVGAARCRHKLPNETSLVIGDSLSASSRYKVAKSVKGIVTVEPVDLKDLTKYAAKLDLSDGHSVSETLQFAETLITNVNADDVISRMGSIRKGSSRKEASEIERLVLEVQENPSFEGLARILSACSRQTGSNTYRVAVLRATLRALGLAQSDSTITFEEAAIRVREEARAIGRTLPTSAIGSTLLLKGLEADHAIVLNAGELDAKNLYVAMTRGSKTLTICSSESVLRPGS